MPLMKPSRHLLTVWRLRLSVAAVLPSFLSAYFLLRGGWLWLLCSCVWVPAFLYFYIFYYPIKLRKLACGANATCLLLHCGVIYTRVKAIPFSGIQYTALTSTPFERLFGICSLMVYTIGSGAYMPGLLPEEAAALQEQLAQMRPSTEDADG